jgi:hypothetical protein
VEGGGGEQEEMERQDVHRVKHLSAVGARDVRPNPREQFVLETAFGGDEPVTDSGYVTGRRPGSRDGALCRVHASWAV